MVTTSRQSTLAEVLPPRREPVGAGRAAGSPTAAWAYGIHMRSDIREATNQAPPLVGHNVVTSDPALVEAVTRHASAEVVDDLVALGAEAAPRRPASTASSPTSTTPG